MSTDNDATTLQEYVISGIVISFFGLLYFYLSGDFTSDNDSSLPVAASSGGYALSSLGSGGADKLSLQSDSKSSSTSPKPDVSKDADTTAEEPTPPEAEKSSQEEINLEEMKAKSDESAQKLAEVKRQLAAGAGASVASQVVPPVAKEESPATDDNQEKSASDELVFKLPDGRKVEIPTKGFENTFREAIVKGDRNTPIVFDRVYFDTGSKKLSSQSDYQITSTAALLNTYKEINIVIRGHSDNKGSSSKNAQLSLFRSGSMKKALVDLGIDSKRIHIEGLGEIEPIDSNKTKRGRRNNRRIDLVIK